MRSALLAVMVVGGGLAACNVDGLRLRDVGHPDDAGSVGAPLPDLSAADLLGALDLTSVVGVGAKCAGFVAEPACEPALFCEWDEGCGGCCDRPAHCRERPASCSAIFDPVCGCDGRQYPNDCVRQQAGVSRLNRGICGCTDECGRGSHCAACSAEPVCRPDGQGC